MRLSISLRTSLLLQSDELPICPRSGHFLWRSSLFHWHVADGQTHQCFAASQHEFTSSACFRLWPSATHSIMRDHSLKCKRFSRWRGCDLHRQKLPDPSNADDVWILWWIQISRCRYSLSSTCFQWPQQQQQRLLSRFWNVREAEDSNEHISSHEMKHDDQKHRF